MENDFFTEASHNKLILKTPPKSLVKWAGGKGMLLSSIVPRFINKSMLQDNGTYLEPFAGSCAMAFHLAFDRMIINDKNIKLMNFYDQVKNRPEKLVRKILRRVDEYMASKDKESYYYSVRDEYNKMVLVAGNGLTHASLFWFINKTCFNGMYRETKNGDFNIPYGKRDCPRPDLNDFLFINGILQKCTICHRPFEKICDMAKSGDIVYLDPPYIPTSKTSSFSDYLRYGFDYEDHKRLCKIMMKMSNRNVHVIMSNSNCDNTKSIYGSLIGFKFREVSVTRLISGKTSGRGIVKELIITNS